jgi:hypothetical protein
MGDVEWSDVLAAATGMPPRHEVAGPPGVRGGLHRARAKVRHASNTVRFEVEYQAARARHRWLRQHTYVESHLLDLDRGCVEYRGLHCLVCDAPAGF